MVEISGPRQDLIDRNNLQADAERNWEVLDLERDRDGWKTAAKIIEAERDHCRARLALLEAVRAASEPLAGAVGELLNGRLLMEPSRHSSMTFEAMLMLIQMLDVHIAAYREAAARLDRGTVGT